MISKKLISPSLSLCSVAAATQRVGDGVGFAWISGRQELSVSQDSLALLSQRGCIVRVSLLLAPSFSHSISRHSSRSHVPSSTTSSFPSRSSPGSPSASSQKLPPARASYPSSFKSVGLPFKGTEISFGDIKPPLNRPLIQVGFGNFFSPDLSCLSAARARASCGRPKRAVASLLCVYPHARTRAKRVATTPSRSYPTAFSSREGIRTVKAGDRLAVLYRRLSPLRFPFSIRHFTIFHSFSTTLTRD